RGLVGLVQYRPRNRPRRVDAVGACALKRPCARTGRVERSESAIGKAQVAMFHVVPVMNPAGDDPCWIDPGDQGAWEGTTCACARRSECDNGGLRTKERCPAEIQDAVTHVASQQPPCREQHAETNECISENVCSHKNFFLPFPPVNLILELRVRKKAKNLAGKCPPPGFRSVKK